MKVAIPVWEDRVSGVLDFSQRLVVVELEHGGERSRAQVALSERNTLAKLAKLRELGIDVVICGAVSQPMASAAVVYGIRLFPYVTGTVNEVLAAYQAGQLSQPQFVLPGWWPGARRGFGRRCHRHHGHREAERQTRNLRTHRRNGADGDGVSKEFQ